MAVLFADFPDAAGSQTTESLYDLNVPGAEEYLERMSGGALDLQFEPLHRWLRMSGQHASYGFSGSGQTGAALTFLDHLGYIQEAIGVADPDFDFAGISSVLVIADPNADSMHSPAFTPNSAFWGVRADGEFITSAVTRGGDWYGVGTIEASPYVVAHEMGHALGLSDLYEIGAPHPALHEPVGNFGIMGLIVGRAGGSLGGQMDPLVGNEMLAWHRWQLGWLADERVACIDAAQASLDLSPMASSTGIGAAVVPVGEFKVVVVENRRRVGYDLHLQQEGVLVYTIDTTRLTGSAPIVVQGSYSGDWPDSAVLLQPGESIVVEGLSISVVSRSAEADLVTVVATP